MRIAVAFGREMRTGHPRLLRALMTCLAPSATVRGAMSLLVLVLALSMSGLVSPAVAATLDNPGISGVDQQAAETGMSERCPAADEGADGVHAGDCCAITCGPQVGTTASPTMPWRVPVTTDLAVALSAPLPPRADAPDPFPPRIPVRT